jgi:response regulator aspartate phosphatase C
MADLYLDMGKNLSSIQHIRQAQELFRQKTNHAVRCADCENIMGINCVELKQYEEAENHLIRALDIAQKNNDDELVMHVRSNLGFLYSEQRLSEVAIRHLTFVYRHRFNLYKTTFLLAREYFRIGENDQAYRLVEEGLAECRRLNHVEFIHRHLILKAFHSNVQMEELEATVKDGIEHFASRKLWHLVQEYTEKLANTFHQRGEYKKASYYYNIGCEAREKLFVEEALK